MRTFDETAGDSKGIAAETPVIITGRPVGTVARELGVV